MKLFQIERGQYPLTEDGNSIDVDAYEVLSSERVEKSSIDEAIKYVKSKYRKRKFMEHIDDCHKYKKRIFLLETKKGIAHETIEVYQGEMVDRYGFGHEEFMSYDENGNID